MQVNSIRQFSMKNNSCNNNRNNTYTERGIPLFKGAKEVEAANKIIKEHATISVSLSLPTALIEFNTREQLIVRNIAQMITKISEVYKIDFDKQSAIKFITDRLATNNEKETSLVTRVIANMIGLGHFADSILAMKFTTKTGEKFVQHCEKVQK